jgi:thiamine-phosphate pyrophosphorylase
MTKPTIQDYRLYLVTDSRLHRGYTVIDQVALALEGGVKIIQIREKSLPGEELTALAARALELTRACNAYLIINDSVETVLAIGADGVHLGQEDMPLTEARRLLGSDRIIGVSVKTGSAARQAESDGADYVAVNGAFPTATKEDLGDIPGLTGIAEIRCNTRLPVVAIGGINLENCQSVVSAGAHGVAVVTAITMSENIPHTCRSFLRLIGEGDSHA